MSLVQTSLLNDKIPLHKIHTVYALSVNDACEWTRAMLHTILFCRVLTVLTPAARCATLTLRNEEIDYAAVTAKSVDRKVEQCVRTVARALDTATVASLAQVELELGMTAAGSAPKQWATWVSDSLGKLVSPSSAALAQPQASGRAYEHWKFRMYAKCIF